MEEEMILALLRSNVNVIVTQVRVRPFPLCASCASGTTGTNLLDVEAYRRVRRHIDTTFRG